MNNIVIIGNGAAGNSAADAIRQHETHIPVIMVAREELPEYSACALPDCIAGRVKREKLFIKKAEDYSRMGIQVQWGLVVRQIDLAQRVLITEGESIAFDRLILATGSRAVIPAVPGVDLFGNFVVKTVADIDAINLHRPRVAVVVGSGNIGIEVAEALQLCGCQVTLVEQRERILPRIFDEEPAGHIRAILSDNGIKVLTGEKVLGIEGRHGVEAVTTDQRTIKCDTVIWAAGMQQNVELAQTAGIKIGKLGGIEVDAGMRTNIEGIYGCGDCIEAMDMLTGHPILSLLWPNAKIQGRLAALNCMDQEVSYAGAVSLVVEDIFGITAVSMGKTSEDLPSDGTTILEGNDTNQYWRIMVHQDRIMGMQSLGMTTGLGAVMGLMKNRIPVSEIRQVLADSKLIQRAGWYMPVRRFLGI